MKLLFFILPFLVACHSTTHSNSSSAKDKLEIDQDVKTNAAIYSDEIVLANSPLKFNMSECGPTPEPGKRYVYEVVNDRLVIDDQRVQVTYERETDEGGLLFGKWNMVSSSDLSMNSGSLEINSNTVHFISICEG